ncbi:MAG: twin-arginine translocation signal domain-containing protein [Chitinophagaceae bacterium]|nr:twin-arginine translocation signal domain-containing protein [Chitinophagaceae bacterium]
MDTNEFNQGTNRRNFLGTIATGAAAISISSIAPTINAFGGETKSIPSVNEDPEEMFKKITGKHRVVFDVTQPHEIYPFAWPRVFLITNEMTGTQAKDSSVVVVLRHTAIGYAMDDSVWTKYNLGEVFKANDPQTGKPALRNPFWKPKAGDFVVPGLGEVMIGINHLQESGVLFCVCEMAITVYSAAIAAGKKLEPAVVKKDFVDSLLPGIQVVPSGVWALGRAQEKQCAYIFAG